MIRARLHNILKRAHNSLFAQHFYHSIPNFAIVILWLYALFAYAETPHIEVTALFEGKAMVYIDNSHMLVSVGEEITNHGIKLISANAREAIFEVNGSQRRYLLGSVVRDQANNSSGQKKADEIIVYQGTDTMFRTTGSINGYPVNFLVDTGASSIAISSKEARRLGINYKLNGKATWVSTASGVEKATAVTLDRVTISGITIRSVEGLVIEGNQPSVPLLGMSYLNRFQIINDGNMMRLKRRY